MPNGSQGIFLSYRRDDAGVSASLLRMCLEQDLPGAQVFKDTESIEPGANFRTRIEDAVRSSAVLLALIGPQWLTATDAAGRRRLFDPDDVLVREITLALRLRLRVIPVLVQGATMPRAEDLPEALGELADLQAEELDDRRLDDYRPRVKYIATTIERSQLEFARAEQERGQRPNGGQVLDRKTPVPEFAEEIKGIRLNNPANAMATLRIFAQERDVDELLRLWPVSEKASGFAPLDAVAILTLAAVDRTPAEAAELTVGLHHAEQGGSGLTESIIHDLTAQRTVPDLAEFIAECKHRGPADLVEETLKAFVGSASRTSLDKALLYFELLRFQCASEAGTLLARTLSAEGARPRADEGTPASAADSGGQRPLAGAIGQVGIVGALRHLSPLGEIVEKWVDERIQTASVNWRETVELVANLLGNEPNGDRLLAKHVAIEWNPAPLIRLCEILAGSAHRASPGLTLVRGYAATRDESSLADMIGLWCLSPVLSGSFPELVAEIVTDGARGPRLRPIPFFDNLALAVDQRRVPAKGRAELLVAAAAYVTGRPGADVAELLGRVGGADRRRAAQRINAQFARGLAAGAVETGLFIAYLNGLKALPDHLTLIFWAVRELTDPTTAASPKLTGQQIGDIAVMIYDDDDDLKDTGFDLLERYLENEQAVTAADAMAIVKQVHTSTGMRQDRRWDALLGATIGRWADGGHRDEVRDEFRRADQPDEGYLSAAAAIMSLPQ